MKEIQKYEEAPPPPPAAGALAAAENSRAVQEIQSALIIAKRFPRDEIAANKRIMTACRRMSLAERALYRYPRGKESVTGPSIRMAEMLAQCWGNIVFGFREIERQKDSTLIEAFAWDQETNTRQTRIFHVDLKRKAQGKFVDIDDPRDQYEHVASMAQRRVRACILAAIPVDVIDAAVAEVYKTLQAGDKAGAPLVDRIKRLVLAFGEYAVTEKHIEKRLKHAVADISVEEIVELQGIYNSLRDKVTRREDWFEVEQVQTTGPGAERARALTKELGGGALPEDEKLPFE